MPVIGDNNYRNFLAPNVPGFGDPHGFGFKGMWQGMNSPAGNFKDFSDKYGIDLLPESEWDDVIDAIEKEEADLKTYCLDNGVVVEDQNGTNYCWINATAFCAKLVRLRETGKVWNYSPASVGAPIKNFTNRGGWGWEGLKYMIDNGINLAEDWPVNAIQRSYYTSENKEKAKKHKVIEYFRLDSWQEVVTVILNGFSVSEGYNWWRHQVAGMHITKRNHNKVIANSWGTGWGEHGYGILEGSRKYANGSVVITSMLPV